MSRVSETGSGTDGPPASGWRRRRFFCRRINKIISASRLEPVLLLHTARRTKMAPLAKTAGSNIALELGGYVESTRLLTGSNLFLRSRQSWYVLGRPKCRLLILRAGLAITDAVLGYQLHMPGSYTRRQRSGLNGTRNVVFRQFVGVSALSRRGLP